MASWKMSSTYDGINPPIRGFNRRIIMTTKDFISLLGINPPIRGSIEQGNALFENYNHKR